MSEATFLEALLVLCGTVAFLGSLWFLYRFLELRNQRRVPVAIDGVQDRLERIELTVEATAVEVERISEANRFIAKLLADRAGAANFAIKPERVITPH